MKILVAVKRVVDHSVRIRLRADGTGVDTSSAKMSINPFDEIAVEAALRLREMVAVEDIAVVSIGTSASQDVLRQSMALGADRGILVTHDGVLEPLAVAKVLAAIARRDQPDLIILGKQAIDDDCGQTGQMVAALLGWPQATFASSIAMRDNALEVVREIDGGLETISVELPAVVTTDLRLNEPRFASLPNIMKAKKKPIEDIAAATLGLDLSPRLELVSVSPPPSRAAGRKVDTVGALAEAIQHVIRGA